ncbi:hypothetical protein EC973_000347 [Apophysomyces ossiformis]|uniref:Uncharacterized protein n=1 Tax=Apophysomyces ossiformis TaxID=679940 RepID=A0A8H7EN56_9FUNG|nr:hypothetical protein EC973_000347 [Apophysomyces ossiformis]
MPLLSGLRHHALHGEEWVSQVRRNENVLQLLRTLKERDRKKKSPKAGKTKTNSIHGMPTLKRFSCVVIQGKTKGFVVTDRIDEFGGQEKRHRDAADIAPCNAFVCIPRDDEHAVRRALAHDIDLSELKQHCPVVTVRIPKEI